MDEKKGNVFSLRKKRKDKASNNRMYVRPILPVRVRSSHHLWQSSDIWTDPEPGNSRYARNSRDTCHSRQRPSIHGEDSIRKIAVETAHGRKGRLSLPCAHGVLALALTAANSDGRSSQEEIFNTPWSSPSGVRRNCPASPNRALDPQSVCSRPSGRPPWLLRKRRFFRRRG